MSAVRRPPAAPAKAGAAVSPASLAELEIRRLRTELDAALASATAAADRSAAAVAAADAAAAAGAAAAAALRRRLADKAEREAVLEGELGQALAALAAEKERAARLEAELAAEREGRACERAAADAAAADAAAAAAEEAATAATAPPGDQADAPAPAEAAAGGAPPPTASPRHASPPSAPPAAADATSITSSITTSITSIPPSTAASAAADLRLDGFARPRAVVAQAAAAATAARAAAAAADADAAAARTEAREAARVAARAEAARLAATRDRAALAVQLDTAAAALAEARAATAAAAADAAAAAAAATAAANARAAAASSAARSARHELTKLRRRVAARGDAARTAASFVAAALADAKGGARPPARSPWAQLTDAQRTTALELLFARLSVAVEARARPDACEIEMLAGGGRGASDGGSPPPLRGQLSSIPLRAGLPPPSPPTTDDEPHTPRGGGRPPRHPRKAATMAMMNLAMAFERTDEVILPAVYSFVAASFGADLLQLSYLTMARALAQALLSPVGGYAGHTFNRVAVISAGCFIWGATMVAFAFATTLGQGIAAWAVTGAGLTLVIPNVQSLTADLHAEADRGKAFGSLHLSSALGAALGGLYATNVGAARPFGWDGWRFAMLLLGAVAFAIGVANLAASADPRAAPRSLRLAPAPGDARRGGPSFWSDLGGVLRVPTFMIIVAQGIVGNIPMAALAFTTLYLQLLQLPPFWASVAVSAGMGAHALGGLLGGFLGDAASRRSPHHGRILVCQASVVLGAVGTAVLLRGLPRTNAQGAVAAYVAVSVATGLVNAWPAPACNNPIFAEIVPARCRNLVYAFDRSFEMAVAALAGGPVVSLIAMKLFGFDERASVSGDPAVDLPKADALSRALLLTTALPWAACVVAYSGAHCTYPRDKRAVAAARGRASPAAPRDRPSLDGGALCESGSAANLRVKGGGGG